MNGLPRLVLGALFGLLTVVALHLGHQRVGYARDEGIYFDASRRYGDWAMRLATDPAGALRQKNRDRVFAINHEHPALMKTIAGVSARVLAKPPVAAISNKRKHDRDGGVFSVMPEGAAMRLPAQILAGIGVAVLFVVGATMGGLWAGLVAAAGFIALPRVWFHAGLHAFDVPIAVAILVATLVYGKSLANRRYGAALGPVVGVAIAIKHNALFLGPLFAVHYWSCLVYARVRHGRSIRPAQWLGLPLVSMGVASPAVAWGLWPWMWSDTWPRLMEYVTFHREHNWYNTEFLGTNFNQPPMPASYPWVMTWATVPTVLLVLAGVGLALGLLRDVGEAPEPSAPQGSFWTPVPSGWNQLRGLLWAALALFPLALISSPNTPIFGGTKHWLTGYPFFALGMAQAWTTLWRYADLSHRWLQPTGLLICLAPSAIATADGHPFGLSQYAAFVGGPRGAADLGLVRGYWGHATLPLLGRVLTSTTVYPHDVHALAIRQYQREGRWPATVKPSSSSRAKAGLFFYEKHMLTYETALWDSLGTTAPVEVLTLDDVPIASAYVKP